MVMPSYLRVQLVSVNPARNSMMQAVQQDQRAHQSLSSGPRLMTGSTHCDVVHLHSMDEVTLAPLQ
jgi:hypothetical protein